jgi:hypothetical protein
MLFSYGPLNLASRCTCVRVRIYSLSFDTSYIDCLHM